MSDRLVSAMPWLKAVLWRIATVGSATPRDTALSQASCSVVQTPFWTKTRLKVSRMGQPNLLRHSLRKAWADLRGWVGNHIVGSSAGLIAALLGVPFYLHFMGASVTALKEQLAQVVAYSLIGPMLLIVVAYLYFFLRAPTKLYAKYVEELKGLRINAGLSINDLEEPMTNKGCFFRILSRYGYPTIVALLLIIVIFFFMVIGSAGRALQISTAVNKVYEAEIPLSFILLQSIADNGAAICNKHHIDDPDCTAARNFAKEFHTHMRAYQGHLLPKAFRGKVPPLP